MATAFCNSCHRYLEHSSLRHVHSDPTPTSSKEPEKKYKPYKYKSLKKSRGSIRVLVLLGNGSDNAEVECELMEIDFKDNRPEHEYEALSWCWGTSKPNGRIIIREGGKKIDKRRLSKRVTPDLVAALKALRYQRTDRYLWIDQICINQENPLEKNHQVEMMAEIYGNAAKVCIWLGEGDTSSRMALEFINKEVLQLQNFDELCESEQASAKWGALLELMQRPWFSRRWVVQEVALAHSAVVYCGADKIAWKKFAVAVELFVEVETATHRLSEVMKKDPRFYHVPGWFEYVSALGASLLVEATGKLFRDYKPNGPIGPEEDTDSETESDTDDQDEDEESSEGSITSDNASTDGNEVTQVVPGYNRSSQGQPLLTLEYLVSSLSIFEVTMPHDAVYALLAIARDTTPLAHDDGGLRRQLVNTQTIFERFTQKKRYIVDYRQPFADVCKEFVAFCIEHSKDRTRALDIICRPWAPVFNNSDTKRKRGKSKQGHVSEKAHDPVGRSSTMSAILTRDTGFSRKSSRTFSQYASTHGKENVGAAARQKKKQEVEASEHDIPLPSWIASLSGAAYAMYSQAGVHTQKMGRKNADTLVGLPPSNQSLERNYNAAETKGVDPQSLRFIKRSIMSHWSLYAQGFVLDEVSESQPSSQGGAIPQGWAQAGGWNDVPDSDPPDAFWRTLVADRGRDGKNPPVYYSRACKESFAKGGLSSGSVNTTDLINNERCSVIAQFCRRVQAVIWNRCLITTKSTTLGLAGQDVQNRDLICILYGCSVPVALRRMRKTKDDVLRELDIDFKRVQDIVFEAFEKRKETAQYRRIIKNGDRALNFLWEKEMRKAWGRDHDGRRAWLERKQGATYKVSEVNKNHWTITLERGEEAFEIAATPTEDRDKVLERKAYAKWKSEQRKREIESGRGLSKEFKREDKIEFQRVLPFARWWRRRVKRLAPSTSVGSDADADETAYIQRYKDKYLEPYKTNKKSAELEEPDWSRTDAEDVRIQAKWSWYQFLGECYVHGMMDGEAMAYQNENSIPAQVFELR